MITLEELRKIVPYTRRETLELFCDPLNDAMREYEISETPLREAAFLAQIVHESGGFVYVKEIASGEAYNGRADLGNTEPEAVEAAAKHNSTPGPFYKGHGLIQITGFYNHRKCGEALGVDLVNNPQLLESPVLACRSAGWFWKDKGLNELADAEDFKRITRIINGGYNGFADRVTYWERAKVVLLA